MENQVDVQPESTPVTFEVPRDGAAYSEWRMTCKLPEAKPAQPKDRQGSYRAATGLNLSQVRPQGLAQVADIGTGVSLLMWVAKGLVNPAAAASLDATSPRLMGELMVAISKASPGLGRATMAAPLLGIPNAGGVLSRRPQDQQ